VLEGLHLGRYRLLERLATGGMAEIYLAEQEADTGLSRNVVIKTILPQFTQDASMRTMLQDEARIGFSLQHRNIVQVVDVGDEQDLLYIAMEYVEGANLAQLSDVTGDDATRQDIGLVAHLGLEVLAALDYAHNRTKDGRPLEIVHRDVSPQNILISTAGEVKLSDFGIALAKGRITRTTIGGIKGKLAYIPPEQATADAVGPSADVFSTAAVLYELLTGSGPYHATTDIGILKAIERGAIGSVATARPDVPEELATAIDRALSAVPSARPTAGEFREQLEPFALPASQAEIALKEQARAARASATQKSKHQRRFENALLGQADGANATTARPMTSTGGSAPSESRSGVSLWYGVVAIAAAVTAFLLWPENVKHELSAAGSLTGSDAAQIIGIPDANVAPRDVGLPIVLDAGQPAIPQPPEKRAAAIAKKGTLSITSFPWAEVEVDGTKVGNTPVRHLRLRAGKHKVVLHNPQSGKRVQRTVTVKPGKNATLRLEL
jgi:serine/threonine protein kinase